MHWYHQTHFFKPSLQQIQSQMLSGLQTLDRQGKVLLYPAERQSSQFTEEKPTAHTHRATLDSLFTWLAAPSPYKVRQTSFLPKYLQASAIPAPRGTCHSTGHTTILEQCLENVGDKLLLWNVKALPISGTCSTDTRVVTNGNGLVTICLAARIVYSYILGLMQIAKLSAGQNNNRFSSHKAIVAAYKFTSWNWEEMLGWDTNQIELVF